MDVPKPKPPVKPLATVTNISEKRHEPVEAGVEVSTKPKKEFVRKPHLTQRPFIGLDAAYIQTTENIEALSRTLSKANHPSNHKRTIR